MRANPIIWRIAKHIYKDIIEYTGWNEVWSHLDKYQKNFWYDKASALYGRLVTNSFTGEDNHRD